jgi:hypothetical protein
MKTHRANFLTLVVVAVACSLATFLLTTGASSVGARQQQFTGNENHVVTLDQAIKYVQNFKNFPTTPTTKGGFFGRNIFDKILAQPGCVGVRYYYAKKDDGSATIVLVGADNMGNDLTQGILGEELIPCPPFCPAPGSLLNR